jgi:hypothetical protein
VRAFRLARLSDELRLDVRGLAQRIVRVGLRGAEERRIQHGHGDVLHRLSSVIDHSALAARAADRPVAG